MRVYHITIKEFGPDARPYDRGPDEDAATAQRSHDWFVNDIVRDCKQPEVEERSTRFNPRVLRQTVIVDKPRNFRSIITTRYSANY